MPDDQRDHLGHLNNQLWDAVRTSNYDQAEKLLSEGAQADQNVWFNAECFESKPVKDMCIKGTKNGRSFDPNMLWGSLFSAATFNSDIKMVRLLVKHSGIDLSDDRACYTFVAGANKMKIRMPAIFALKKDNVEYVKELVACKADLMQPAYVGKQRQTNNESHTLIWDRSSRGHSNLVRYILETQPPGVPSQLGTLCDSVDNPGVMYSPLHQAADRGHLAVVRTLIEWKAEIDQWSSFKEGMRTRRDSWMPILEPETPLMVAIEHAHSQVVRALVGATADVFSKANSSVLFQGVRGYNVKMLEAAVHGLTDAMKEDRKRLVAMMIGDGKQDRFIHGIVRFLSVPGDSDIHALAILFQRKRITYWADQEVGVKRQIFDTACIKNQHFNVAVGPSAEHFHQYFEDVRADKAFTAQEHAFLRKLFPAGHEQVTVESYQCLLPDVHQRPEILFALAEQDGALFKSLPCQALLELSWQQMVIPYTLCWFNSLTLVTSLFLWSYLNFESSSEEGNFMGSRIVFAVMAFSYSGEVIRELNDMFGQFCIGNAIGKVRFLYLRNPWNYVEWFRIAITGTLLFFQSTETHLFTSEDSPDRVQFFRFVLACAILLRWIGILFSLGAYSWCGPSLLPIITTFRDVGSFSLVIIFPLLGFTHAYYTFGIYSEGGRAILRTFMTIYGLTVGNFELEDMEDVSGNWVKSLENGTDTWHQLDYEDPERQWLVYLDVFVVLATAVLTVLMMNIFIGVLSNSYSEASKISDIIFWRFRARIVYEGRARFLVRERLIRAITFEVLPRRANCARVGDSEAPEGASNNYAWYCCESKSSFKTELEQSMEKCKGDLAEMRKELQSMRAASSFEVKQTPKSVSSETRFAPELVVDELRGELQRLKTELSQQIKDRPPQSFGLGSGSPPGSPRPMKAAPTCPNNHKLRSWANFSVEYSCDNCERLVDADSAVWTCKECNLFYCPRCNGPGAPPQVVKANTEENTVDGEGGIIGILRLDGAAYSAPKCKKAQVLGDLGLVETWNRSDNQVFYERAEGYTFDVAKYGWLDATAECPVFEKEGIIKIRGAPDDPRHMFVPNRRGGPISRDPEIQVQHGRGLKMASKLELNMFMTTILSRRIFRHPS